MFIISLQFCRSNLEFERDFFSWFPHKLSPKSNNTVSSNPFRVKDPLDFNRLNDGFLFQDLGTVVKTSFVTKSCHEEFEISRNFRRSLEHSYS